MKTKPKRKPIFTMTIRKKLILSFILILLVPSVTIGLISYLNAQSNIKEKIQISSRENVLVIDKFITSFIEPKENAATYFSGLFNKASFTEEKIPTTIAHLKEFQVLNPETMVVYVALEENGDFLAYPEQDLPDGYDPRVRPWYIGAKAQSGEPLITEPYIDAFTGGVIVTIAHALEDGSGVFAMDLSLQALNKLTEGIKIGKAGYPILLSAEGNYLVHPKIEAGTKEEGSWVQSLLEKKDGQVVDNQNQIDFTTNDRTGIKIAGVMDLGEVNQDTKPILMTTLLIVGLFIVIGALLSYFVIRSITRPLNGLVAATEKVSEGDLTQAFDVKNNDEISYLGVSFNKMVGALRELIQNVDAKSEMLAASSQQLMASAEQNNTATEQIVDAIQEVASGTERQSKMVEDSHHIVMAMSAEMEGMLNHSQAVRETSMDAVGIVNNGNQAIQLTSQQMTNIHKTISRLSVVIEDLRKRSIDINQIIDVISGIADQTNLLALNAAIEAARAGENGKGFAVVADEVRKLAEQSSRSTETIRQLISSIQIDTNHAVESMEKGTTEIEKGMDLAQSAGEAFHEIKQFIDHVNNEIQTISVSIKETSAGTEQVVGVVHGIEEIAVKTTADSQNVSAATEEQLASMQEITASASSLSYMAEELQEIIKQFKI
ncbi:methyl-accepting chemotaxis protein [Bacillus sp. DTU_2020_1000418_1_SI_GHA_SEK_038]|nr:methyl-accepting chemotaxis protein [Bacillus sp. DTU_2020_1000418_1_SI_GHA_SEK_038]WNS75236.1 methyl-accepting chemotaxis protein [Bacillus sp. DTU_2020_1000418_1_SI_GHA_SEK_038]